MIFGWQEFNFISYAVKVQMPDVKGMVAEGRTKKDTML